MDVVAQNALLDNSFGPAAGAASPASLDLHLYIGDPEVSGVEVSGNGYVPGTVPAAAWAPADGGQKATTAPVECGVPTAEWTDTVTHILLTAPDGTWRIPVPLLEPLDVTGPSSTPVRVTPVLFFENTTAI